MKTLIEESGRIKKDLDTLVGVNEQYRNTLGQIITIDPQKHFADFLGNLKNLDSDIVDMVDENFWDLLY